MLVVGAGPAGLSAARALALAGADVIVLDERLYPGGQFFKPLAPSHQAEISTLDSQFRDGAVLAQSTLQAGVRIVNEATVWAAFSPHEVAAIVAGQSQLYRPRRLVLAAGAYEQSPTIPGWTLPGVMTVGGLADAGALLPRGAGRAHRDRGQRPALPADRRRAFGRRRRRRGRARGGAAARPRHRRGRWQAPPWPIPS